MNYEAKKVEDCFDGSRIFEYQFELPIDPVFIKKLGTLGRLEHFKDFPRPFFRVITKTGNQFKGVEGEKVFKAIFTRSNLEQGKEELEIYLQGLTWL